MNRINKKLNLIGNLGMDPEFKALDGGKTLDRFSVATSNIYKNNQGEKVNEAQCHNVVAWGKTA